jgi:hypothetical protein
MEVGKFRYALFINYFLLAENLEEPSLRVVVCSYSQVFKPWLIYAAKIFQIKIDNKSEIQTLIIIKENKNEANCE